MSCFESLQHYLNASFGRDTATAKKLREGLDKALDLAPKMTEVTERLEDTPEATTNKDFVKPPDQFTEEATQKELLEELGRLSSRSGLQSWYEDQRARIDTVVSPSLRDKLFDAIRAKKRDLGD